MGEKDDVVALVGVLGEFGSDGVDVGVEIGRGEGGGFGALNGRQGDGYAGVACIFEDADGGSEGRGSVPGTGDEQKDWFRRHACVLLGWLGGF